ncbi:MAG: ABC transporter permease [Planctomycetes bacterium]|nr:ABC transporter permease [Planctomycetota bacterium]
MKRSEWIGEFWRYRELFLFLVWRELKVRYKQTALGASWALLQPLLTMAVFTVIFGRYAELPRDGLAYPLFFFSVLVPWTYFASALTNAGNSLVANIDLLTKVYFPRAALPASAVLAGLLDFAVAFLFLAGMLLYYAVPPSLEMLLWPLLLLLLVLLALGAGMLFAALNVNFRDVKYALPFVVQVWMFASPTMWTLNSVEEPRWRVLAALNPLGGVLQAFRDSINPNCPVDWLSLGISAAATLLLFLAGGAYFQKTERTFADLI